MFSIHASYRGRARRRADYVRDVADALAATAAVSERVDRGPVDFVVLSPEAEGATTVILNLLQAGDFAIGVAAVTGDPADVDESQLVSAAGRALGRSGRAGSVAVRIESSGPGGVQAPGAAVTVAADIAAAFTLIAHVLSRRTAEGREATSLMRRGYLQSEAAQEVGISKQAMSQRLSAAGWQAEQAGWELAVHMLARVGDLPAS
ncbi:DNA-binding protein [Corynebacterium bovis]|uniref:DNA-binding protein n=1 Tax=Corynebacterium bovis TaxID=36808 RepID=UPI00254DB509|nr:DNA-binding protein [Corynebacterium bovis]MDK8509880.1 DNA-binding protein [Corynebacterium bovis]